MIGARYVAPGIPIHELEQQVKEHVKINMLRPPVVTYPPRADVASGCVLKTCLSCGAPAHHHGNMPCGY